MHMNIIICFIC